MWAKLLLGVLFLAMIGGAVHFDPVRKRALLGAKRRTDGPRLRLMTWNIGYASLEEDSRAHTNDLQAVAETILRHDPDGVALQELADAEQLEVLLRYLKRRYRGAISSFGNSDRIEAVLVKDREARFDQIPAGDAMRSAPRFTSEKMRPKSSW